MNDSEMARQRRPAIAYVIKCFPRLSETFIMHEVLELERRGLPLRIASLLRPGGKVSKAAQDVQASIDYVPSIFPGALGLLLRAAGQRFWRNPLKFLRVCAAAQVRFHHRHTPKHLLYAAYVANQFEHDGITHLHAHYANTPAKIALLVSQFTGIPFSFTAHAKDIYTSAPDSVVYKMQQARFVVTCTGYNQRYLKSLLPEGSNVRIHRIYHGINLRMFPQTMPEPAGQGDCPLILTVARLVEKKGLPYLLEACRILKDQGYDFTCRIVGEGPLRPQLEEQIRELQLTGHVELWGAETHERVIEMYRRATLFALPCTVSDNGDRDGIPNVLVEASAMGVPVVSTPVSGIPELIADGENGLLVPDRDAAALAQAIACLLVDPSLRFRLAVSAFDRVHSEFDMAINVERLHTLLLAQLTPEHDEEYIPIEMSGVR